MLPRPSYLSSTKAAGSPPPGNGFYHATVTRVEGFQIVSFVADAVLRHGCFDSVFRGEEAAGRTVIYRVERTKGSPVDQVDILCGSSLFCGSCIKSRRFSGGREKSSPKNLQA